MIGWNDIWIFILHCIFYIDRIAYSRQRWLSTRSKWNKFLDGLGLEKFVFLVFHIQTTSIISWKKHNLLYISNKQADKRKSFLVILDIKNKSTVRHFNDGKFLIATLDWSPIEHKIVLSAKYKRQFDLWLLDTSNGSAKQLTDLLTIDTDAKFSADGKKQCLYSDGVH